MKQKQQTCLNTIPAPTGKSNLLAACSVFACITAASLSAQTRAWDGGGATSGWNNADNWDGNIALTSGADVVFALPSSRLSANQNLGSGFAVNSLTINSASSYTLFGGSIALASGGLSTSGASAEIGFAINLSSAGTSFNVSNTTEIGGALTGTGGIALSGGGTLVSSGGISYSGTTTISGSGTKMSVLGGSTVTAYSVGSAAILTVSGMTGNVDIASGGILDVRSNTVITGNVTSAGFMDFTVNSESGHDMLSSSSSIDISDTSLTLSFGDSSVNNMWDPTKVATFIADPSVYMTSSVYRIISTATTGLFDNLATLDDLNLNYAGTLGLGGSTAAFSSGGQDFWVYTDTVGNTGTYLVAIPEPSVTLLGALGVLGLVSRRRRH